MVPVPLGAPGSCCTRWAKDQDSLWASVSSSDQWEQLVPGCGACVSTVDVSVCSLGPQGQWEREKPLSRVFWEEGTEMGWGADVSPGPRFSWVVFWPWRRGFVYLEGGSSAWPLWGAPAASEDSQPRGPCTHHLSLSSNLISSLLIVSEPLLVMGTFGGQMWPFRGLGPGPQGVQMQSDPTQGDPVLGCG